MRLVLGKKALTTAVTQLVGGKLGIWQLDAITPPSREVVYPPLDVPLAVQALRGNGEIIDSLLIGKFTFTHGAFHCGSKFESSTHMPTGPA